MASYIDDFAGLGELPVNRQLFQPWPTFKGKGEIGPLEPHGNPAYEGTGYPAAGYGMRRRKVVGLALPKKLAPQLGTNGWEGKVPQGTKITPMGTLNTRSDSFSRELVGALSGLSVVTDPLDARFASALRGLGQASDSTTKQGIIDGLVRGVLPDTFVNRLVKKLVDDEKAVVLAYNNIQQLKKKDPKNAKLAALEKQQQEAWGKVNSAKYYALLIPEFQKRLGYTTGKRLVSPPDYNYIRSKADSGLFDKVADWLRDKVVQTETAALLKKGYITGSLNGLGEPISLTAISIGVAAVAGAALWAFLAYNDPARIAADSEKLLTQAVLEGKLTPQQAKEMSQASKEAVTAAGESSGMNVKDIAKYAAYGVGAIILLQVLGSVKSLAPARP